MGYSKSSATVHANWDLLRPLFSSKDEVVWTVIDDESAARLAYKIRECFSIARRKYRELPQLAEAASQYVINTKGNQVIARRIETSERQALAGLATQEHSPAPALASKIFPRAITFEQVIQTWLDNGPSVEFIESVLGQPELNQLQSWCENMVPELEMLAAGKGFHIHLKGVSQ